MTMEDNDLAIMCLTCCGARKTTEIGNAQALVGGKLTPLPEVRPAITWVPTPQGVVPTCYEHIVVVANSPLVGGNGSPISRLLN